MRRSLTLPALLAFAAAARTATAQEVIPYDPLGRPPPVLEPSPPPALEPSPPPEPSPAPRAKEPPPVPAPLTPAPRSAPPQAADPETPVPRLRLPPSDSVLDPPPPLGPPPSEGGLGAVQILSGTLGMVLITFPIVLSASFAGGALGVPALLTGPAIGGYIVCAVGRRSTYYEGSCASAIGGAYLGALTAIPLAYYGCKYDQPSSSDEDFGCIGGLLLGLAVGYFVGTAVGATIGWHLGKTPRARAGLAALSASPPPPPADDWPELRRRPAITGLAGREGARVTVPLLALSF